MHFASKPKSKLRILVESSPAAIITSMGRVWCLPAIGQPMDADVAASETLKGRRIGGYLPVLFDALAFRSRAIGLRTAAQCQGFRDNGEVFLAIFGFPPGARRRESAWLRLSSILPKKCGIARKRICSNCCGQNQIGAASGSHEVRNLCGAIAVVSANLTENTSLARTTSFRRSHRLCGA